MIPVKTHVFPRRGAIALYILHYAFLWTNAVMVVLTMWVSFYADWIPVRIDFNFYGEASIELAIVSMLFINTLIISYIELSDFKKNFNKYY